MQRTVVKRNIFQLCVACLATVLYCTVCCMLGFSIGALCIAGETFQPSQLKTVEVFDFVVLVVYFVVIVVTAIIIIVITLEPS